MTPPAASLTTRTARAAWWRVSGAIVGAASQFGVGVVLARLLMPADFGVAALAYVVLGLAQPLGDFGAASAVVQRDTLTERHIRTAFTATVVLGIAIAAVMAVLAPLGASLMRDARVTPVLRLLSIGTALRGTSAIAAAMLRRRLDFKQLFIIDTASYLGGFAGVAVPLALLDYGVWSLVWGGVAQALVASGGQLIAARHSMRPLLARRGLRELFGFGAATAASACVNYLALNGDYFVVGRLMGAFSLGLYRLAYMLMNVPYTHAASVVSAVMFPAFAQVQSDTALVRRGFLAVTRLTAMVAAPAMAILAVAAPHFVAGVYGGRWAGAVLPLQILSVAGYFRALYHLGGVVAQSLGRVYGELWRQVTYAAAVIAGTAIGSQHGLPGVATGVAIAIVYMFFATGQLVLQATETTWRAYLGVQAGAIATAAFTGIVALSARLLLEASGQSGMVVAGGVAAVGAIPWGLGLRQTIGGPDFAPLRAGWPDSVLRLVTPSGRRAVRRAE